MTEFWQNVIGGIILIIVGALLGDTLKAFIKKLGKQFEDFFQSLGFGFQKRYYRALIKSHQWLKLIGIYNPSDLHAPRLQEVYISLSVSTAKDAPPVAWNRIFSGAEKHLVVLGQPGAGKSTLLDYLTLIFAGHIKHALRTELKNPTPIFVRLRDLGTQSLLTLIESPVNVELKNIPKGYFERRLRNGNCVVLLDGLDEVLDEAAHKKVVGEIKSFANEYPDNWILVTCRVAGWNNQLPDFRQYHIQDFDREDVRRFIGAWYREVTRTEEINKLGLNPKPEAVREAEKSASLSSSKQAENLWNALLKNEGLLRIARTPLILSLITLVHKSRTADLPKGRARLYEQCLNILLDIWDSKDKGLVVSDAPSPNDKLLVLKTIAFHYVKEGLLAMDIEGLERLVLPLLSSLTKPVGAKSLIRQIYERSGVLVEQSIGKYGFAHRALHDYLAAKYIEENNLDSLLIDHAAEERWREVILIAIGLVKPKRRAEVLLDSLLRRSDESAASLALAGWSLAEDVQIEEELRAAVRIKIMRGLERARTLEDFKLLSGAMMDADPEAMRKWAMQALSGRDPNLQKRILTSLVPDLGLERANLFIPKLIQILADACADIPLRAQCALTIARLKPQADSELWRVLEAAREPKQDAQLKTAATWACCELGRLKLSGIELIKIPAGEFWMGSSDEDKEAQDDEKPQHSLDLPDYYIAKTPVTVRQYREFVQASGYKTRHELALTGVDDHPVVWVSWRDALAFAGWHGLTLPSEAEWEKAARGTDGLIYPWGNEWKEGYANTAEYWYEGSGFLRKLLRRNVNRTTTPVGSFPKGNSPYGCVDMAGNVCEWTRSLYEPYPYDPHDGREDLNAEGARVLRGGSFFNSERGARCAFRNGADYLRGFRVAASSFSPV